MSDEAMGGILQALEPRLAQIERRQDDLDVVVLEMTKTAAKLRTERDEAAARFSVLWTFLQWVRTRDWTLDRLDQRAAELHDEGPAEIGINIVLERDDARAAAQVQADEIARLKAEHATEKERGDFWFEQAHRNEVAHEAEMRCHAITKAEHAATQERLAPAFRDHLETLKVNAQLMSETAVLRAELQRAHEAGERMQADLKMLREMGDARMAGFEAHGAGVSLYDNPTETSGPCGHIGDAWETGWLLAAGNKARADFAAAVKRATALESANALGSAQVTQLQEELAATTAKLGRAVRVLIDWEASGVMPAHIDDVWADRDSMAAGEAYGHLVTAIGHLYRGEWATNEERDQLIDRAMAALNRTACVSCGMPGTLTCKGCGGECKVDARRGGGR